jgi:chorismate lyase / 3-hydroxybenzoate synthase
MRISFPCTANIVRAASEEAMPPPWVLELVDADPRDVDQSCSSRKMTCMRTSRYTLISVRLTEVLSLDANRLRRATFDAYRSIQLQLKAGEHLHPVRFWNYIPAIHDLFEDCRNRYMAFNAGRFDAFMQWYGGPGAFALQLPTASGVGCAGTDLVVHCLAGAAPGKAMENPRQIPSYRYSSRFGPLPPCFARATMLPAENVGATMLLVGGTASVRGEDSVFPDDLSQQSGETLVNLASLVRAAVKTCEQATAASDRELLGLFHELRVYYPRASQQDQIVAALQPAFSGLRRLELMQTDLCRDELLIEIEGMAVL